MNIRYPDVAFTTAMQFVLFLVNVAVVSFSCYCGLSLLLGVMQKKPSAIRKIIYSVIAAFFSSIFMTYAVAFAYGQMSGLTRLHLGDMLYMATTPLPTLCFLYYFLGFKILKLPAVICASFVDKSYILSICTTLCFRICNDFLVDYSYADPRGFNYLHGIFKLFFSLFPLASMHFGLYYLIKRLGYTPVYPDNIEVGGIPQTLFKRFLLCCGVYWIVISVLHYPMRDSLHLFLLLIIFSGFFLFMLVLDFNRIRKRLIMNQNEHITELNTSIEQFRGIRHDFNNIIQTYGGYITIGAYDQLKQYHYKMAGDVLSAENYLDFSKRIPENPPFFYLLIKKADRARVMGINFDARFICNMEAVFIEMLDFSRIIAIFLDNALEEAANLTQGHVSFSAQEKSYGSKLIIISNDTSESLDLDRMLQPGYTTKAGHMGMGLAQVRTTLGKYRNAMLDFTFYKNTFTVYLELMPPD